MKERVRVFLSFEFGKDDKKHHNFYSQAKCHSKYEIIDESLNEPYYPDAQWLNKARVQIKKSDIVIVMLGQDTHNAPGVEKELGEAHQLKKPMFQVRPQGRTYGEVRGACEVIPWKWKQIDAKIAEKLSELCK
ncbi:MAG: TIR domain-containing protein [Candidatus Poribacteria bacterium]|nr:TIR domain-containing protein [Candidatus Poribacteria bacterium]